MKVPMHSYPIPDFLDLMGDPFERGARGPHVWDCYGYVRELFGRTGVELPDFESPGSLEEVEDIVQREPRVNAARWRPVPVGTPGALLTFRVDGHGAHVGFMLRNDRFTHCIEGEGVTTERLTNGRYKPLASYYYE
jgi:cell wall-associated NlpC family hydrolase